MKCHVWPHILIAAACQKAKTTPTQISLTALSLAFLGYSQCGYCLLVLWRYQHCCSCYSIFNSRSSSATGGCWSQCFSCLLLW